MLALLPKSLGYHLLPGRPYPHFPDLELYEETYRFWSSFWTRVFKDIQPDHRLTPDEFFRQDHVAVMTDGRKPIGIHAYTFHDVRSPLVYDHSYFTRYYPQAFLDELKNRNICSLMTMEYFGVSPQWRAARAEVSLAAVIAGLGFRLAIERGMDAVITVARQDVGAAKMSRDFGGTPIVSGVDQYNVKCDLVLFPTVDLRPYPNEEVNRLVDYFWQRRNDITHPAGDRPQTRRHL